MKPPNILVTLLTSGGIEYLKEAVKCILNQKDTTMQYGLVIIVNTLDDEYYNKVVTYFKYLEVTRTPSNGKPGKGHNSVLHYFKTHPQYDYIVPIDGDDFLYPCALSYIESYIKLPKPTDILLLMYTDNIVQTRPAKPVPYICVHNKGYLIWNFNHITHKQWYIDKGVNPFNNNINKLNTPCRIMLLSRASLQNDIHYDENCFLYDDFIPFIQIFELIYTTKLSIIKTDFTGIMLYNCLEHNSASSRYNKDHWVNENDNFKKSITNKFTHIQEWDLTTIPYLNMPTPSNFNFKVKYDFVKTLFSNLQLEDNIYLQKDYKEFYRWYTIIAKEAKMSKTNDIYGVYMDFLIDIKGKIIS